jgi:hypothetical protein
VGGHLKKPTAWASWRKLNTELLIVQPTVNAKILETEMTVESDPVINLSQVFKLNTLPPQLASPSFISSIWNRSIRRGDPLWRVVLQTALYPRKVRGIGSGLVGKRFQSHLHRAPMLSDGLSNIHGCNLFVSL